MVINQLECYTYLPYLVRYLAEQILSKISNYFSGIALESECFKDNYFFQYHLLRDWPSHSFLHISRQVVCLEICKIII